MSNTLKIDLTGIEHKWSKSGHSVCAVCGKDYDNLPGSEYEKENGDTVPLQMFKGTGENTSMLTLCWGCAEPRMKAATVDSADGQWTVTE